MGRRCPGNGESIQLQFALSSAELLSAHSMTLLDNRSTLTSSSRHRRRDLCSCDSCSLEPPSTARFFSRYSVFKACLASKRQRIYSEKRCSSSPSFSSTYNLTTDQHAPRSLKWAGAEMTLQTAWIKSPILPGFCLNGPPAVGSSRQVALLEGTAVVRDAWS